MADKNSAETAGWKKTPLFEIHRQYGAKMVDFAGYAMPVNYRDGILKEHTHTREAAGLFDVSHMGQLKLTGGGAAKSLERLLPVDVIGLGKNRQRYALFTNEGGGILDDLMVTNAGSHLYLVVNASRKAEDLAYLESNLDRDCSMEVLDNHALLALQGPAAAGVMKRIAPQSGELVFMQGGRMDVAGIDCFVTRSGYTGEDGFEISLPAEAAMDLAKALLSQEAVRPVGLGARDTLRLEAGLCLYGQDIDETTTPVEAELKWALSKVRRPGGDRSGGYPGFEVISSQLKDGTDRLRVGILAEGRAPVRGGAELVDKSGRTVGKITSGGYGATVGGPVAMAYVESSYGAEDTRLNAAVRDRVRPVRVAKLPFVRPRYYRG
ncbi:MAG: glycine cleavage system aminomethyltransferase GcvT [Gammaproteobacteria bacterium]|nr:glycine cleavage system aminomethyltransferase GcvT [Gammaproteobacteria bacterium]MDH3411003.1 glycine cleavage system aminomethyltransferase GcvT [Gammaproteobacteria bacterium]